MPEHTAYTPDEIVERGEEIYRTRILPGIGSEHNGDFLVMDVVSEDYEIARRHVDAAQRMLARHPDGMLYSLRIGHKTAYRIGRNVR